MDKKTVYLAMSVGGLAGSYLPVLLFHVDSFGFVSIIGGVIGSIAGIMAAYKLSQ